jgi:hypothetical protein
VISRHHGKPWAELNEDEQLAAMKDYAVSLAVRQGGVSVEDDVQVSFDEGTFSRDRTFPKASDSSV